MMRASHGAQGGHAHEAEARHTRAVLTILVAVLGFSMSPMFLWWGASDVQPLGLNAAWRAGMGTACLVWVAIWGRAVLAGAGTFRVIGRTLARPRNLLLLAGLLVAYFDFLVLGLATRGSTLAIVTIVYNSWPILAVVGLLWMFKAQGRYRRVPVSTWISMALGWVFLALVLASEHGGFGPKQGVTLEWWVALALAVAGAGLGAMSTCSFKLGSQIAKMVREHQGHVHPDSKMELAAVTAVTAVGCFGASLIASAGAIAHAEPQHWPELGIGWLGGAATAGLAGLAWRFATIKSPRAEINSMLMLTPVVSLGWIALIAGVEVREPMWLVIGLIGLILTNTASQIRSKWAQRVEAEPTERSTSASYEAGLGAPGPAPQPVG